MSRVLVVEDEVHLAQGLRFNLEAEGYAAEVVGDGLSEVEGIAQRSAADEGVTAVNGFKLRVHIRSVASAEACLMREFNIKVVDHRRHVGIGSVRCVGQMLVNSRQDAGTFES